MGVSGTQDEVIHPKSRSEELPKSALAQQFWVKNASLPSPPPHRITDSEHLALESNPDPIISQLKAAQVLGLKSVKS